MTAHRGVDYESLSKLRKEPVFDLTTGSIYEILFACVDEQAQTRGGLENYGDRVVNLQKVEKLQDEFEERVTKYFSGLDGISVESRYSLGGEWGYEGHYIHFVVNIKQTLKSMWDLNIDEMTLKLVDTMADKFKYLHTKQTDRTELILNATERV
jgi:hypothetical protein